MINKPIWIANPLPMVFLTTTIMNGQAMMRTLNKENRTLPISLIIKDNLLNKEITIMITHCMK